MSGKTAPEASSESPSPFNDMSLPSAPSAAESVEAPAAPEAAAALGEAASPPAGTGQAIDSETRIAPPMSTTDTADAVEAPPPSNGVSTTPHSALPSTQAPPPPPPTFESEEIIISPHDAPPIVTTTTAPPTMTSALGSSAPQSDDDSAAVPSLTSQPTTEAAGVLASETAAAPIIAMPNQPAVPHQVRSNGNTPSSGSQPAVGPKYAKTLAKPTSNEKPAEAAAVGVSSSPSTKKPLTLLELPVDILRLIVNEITHTNDLTAMALANSTLYTLAIPHIYSRFDIVWPDPQAPPSEGKSVDALTYGLSTLCLGSAFARTAHRLRSTLRRGGSASNPGGRSGPSKLLPESRFCAPDYAKYTRKFSLGNGPRDWVAEYRINKESGKMLGTLVSLCVAKMRNLENFIWDMPTGVVSDVFMALASLPDFDPEHNECKLDRIWIRWHNNSDTSPPGSRASTPSLPPPPPLPSFVAQGSSVTPVGIMLPAHSAHPTPRPTIPYSSSNVEFPTFSVIPPLRSLNVLDIDEIAYIDELAVLIERSQPRLTELRIGIAAHATNKDFVQAWDGPNLWQVDLDAHWPGESTIGDRRLGGVLGVLVGRVYDIRRKTTVKSQSTRTDTGAAFATPTATGTTAPGEDNGATSTAGSPHVESADVDAPVPSESATDTIPTVPDTVDGNTSGHANGTGNRNGRAGDDMDGANAQDSRLDKKLKLTILELERVPLSMQVLVRAMDWSTITSLTILSCPQHEGLWRQLRKHFRPTPAPAHHGFGLYTSPSSAANAPSSMQYSLALKSIHTDCASKALLSFIKDTLKPNSLEVLFLQHRRRAGAIPPVSIQEIFKSAIKPHRASLTKLLIDGDLRALPDHHEPTRRRRAWDLPKEVLDFISSGRMVKLRELAFSLDYANWHPFLRCLPNLTELQALHIQNIADPPTDPYSHLDAAMQIANIVTLRPSLVLCFVGIGAKCFEVIEWTKSGDSSDSDGAGGVHGIDSVSVGDGTDTSSSEDDEEEDEDDDDEDEDSDDDDDHHHHHHQPHVVVNGHGHGNGNGNGNGNAHNDSDGDDSDSVSDDGSSLDGDSPAAQIPCIRMREIFFYEDKVAIFKARHGRL